MDLASRRAVASGLALALLAGVGAVTSDALTAREAAPRRVVLVTDFGGCASTATLGLCDGFKRAVRLTHVSGRIVTPTIREDLSDALVLIAKQRYDLVITFGIWFTDELTEAARRVRAGRFATMDTSQSDVAGQPRNVHGVIFRTSEAAYLAGWLAGSLERRRPGRDVVGAVGGVKIPVVDEFIVGFKAGARRAAPGIRVLTGYSHDFLDAARCRAIARNQIAKGAGIIFNVAGACGLGTLDAAREAGIWGIGVDTDQSQLGPHVLTSVLKRYDAGFLALLRSVKADRVVMGRDTILTMRDGAVGLGTLSTKVPPAMRAELDRLRRRIVAGEIRVPGLVPNP